MYAFQDELHNMQLVVGFEQVSNAILVQQWLLCLFHMYHVS